MIEFKYFSWVLMVCLVVVAFLLFLFFLVAVVDLVLVSLSPPMDSIPVQGFFVLVLFSFLLIPLK